MKKSLIALAVLTSVVGVAQAQSSVTVYGVVDAILHKDKGAPTALTSGGLSGSRLGFKGSEDLGGGLNANFLVEHGFNVDTGKMGKEGSFANRQAYVGLSGGFGEVKLGNVYTAYDDIAGATNSVFDSLLSPEQLMATIDYTSRPGNNLYYSTPSLGGVSGAISTSLKEGAANGVSALHAKFEGGPVYAGLAYQKEGERKLTRVNGSYDLGAAKLLAGFGNAKLGSASTKDLNLGVDVPLGPVTLSAGYARTKPDGADTSSGIGLGAAYDMSKRTTMYGGFLKGKDSSAIPETRFGVGLRHKF